MTPTAVAPLGTKGGEPLLGEGVMVRMNAVADFPCLHDSRANSWSLLLVPVLQADLETATAPQGQELWRGRVPAL